MQINRYRPVSRLILLTALAVSACRGAGLPDNPRYGEAVAFLRNHTRVIELTSSDPNVALAVCPGFQGRVMTSTAQGPGGDSNGWLNPQAIQQAEPQAGGNPYGGEDRLWIGPLGSQHSLYYQRIKPLSEDNWYIPKAFDAEAFKVEHRSRQEVSLSHPMDLVNFSGTRFKIHITRSIRLYETAEIEAQLGIAVPHGLACIGYESRNKMTHTGSRPWSRDTGLLSLWSLGMFQGRERAVMLLPVQKQASLADINIYLGSLDRRRLQLKNNCVYIKADGRHRSKVCIPPHIVKTVIGSYDPQVDRLTLVQFPYGGETAYFNSHVTIQDDPYRGEVVHTYNHGATDPHGFYELESTAPSVALTPSESQVHTQRVYHFTGPLTELNKVAKACLGIELHGVAEMFARP